MKLLVLGATVRAAANSALRAGLLPVCADFFADRDVRSICPATRIQVEPSGVETLDAFESFAAGQEAAAWMYTGPLENHATLVDRISGYHRLWGNRGEVLRAVRDPNQVAECLERAGLPAPRVSRSLENLPRDGSWLLKPLASGGGLGIASLTPTSNALTGRFYFQQRLTGRSYSALFLGGTRRSSLVGVSRQFRGAPGNPFAYRGNLGPLVCPDRLGTQLGAIGNALASRFGLVGLFGVDFILHEKQAYTVEVNPRYTGSVEVFELATKSSLLLAHRRLCESETSQSEPRLEHLVNPAHGQVVSKWVLYATAPFVFPDFPIGSPAIEDPYRLPEIADIPEAGLVVDRGEPVMTVFAMGRTPKECGSRLRSTVRHWRRQLRFVS